MQSPGRQAARAPPPRREALAPQAQARGGGIGAKSGAALPGGWAVAALAATGIGGHLGGRGVPPPGLAMTDESPRFGFDHSYARLPGRMFARVAPTSVAAPRLIAFNRPLAAELGLDADAILPHAAAIFSGNRPPADALPIAQVYAGHQFGHFSPRLGDGRAILLGELIDAKGLRRDVQLKGAGPTPFSRRGDGRAALGPVLREYLVSEAMHALGVPTTRALAAVTTGERVVRERLLPGAVVTRVAASHIRVGTFEFFASTGDGEALSALLAHAIARHDPDAAGAERPALAFLAGVARRQAALVARWMLLGFIHGVMNTDNMAVSGETIDFGPCAFMEAYHPATVFSAIDEGGRYAYAAQPRIAQWNLVRLAEALLPLIDADPDAAATGAAEALNRFPGDFADAWLGGLRAKLGLSAAEEDDRPLTEALLAAMAEGRADFTLAFRHLADAALGDDAPLLALFEDPGQIAAWLARWRVRLARDPQDPQARAAAMRAVSPRLIPRNHRVEEAIAAAEDGDFAPFERLGAALARPFDDDAALAAYALPARPEERVARTFCGT